MTENEKAQNKEISVCQTAPPPTAQTPIQAPEDKPLDRVKPPTERKRNKERER